MIQKDNEAACVGLVQLGAAVKVNTVVKPRVDLDTYYHHETAGQTDGLTLTLKDVGSAWTYLDIHHAIKASSTLNLRSRSSPPFARWSSRRWQAPLGTTSSPPSTPWNLYHRVAARTHWNWNSGGAISSGDRCQWLAWHAPFKF